MAEVKSIQQINRKLWIKVIRVMLTAGLITWILTSVAWSGLTELASSAHWSFVITALGFLVISHLVNVLRWQLVLRDRTMGYGVLLACYGAGLFGGNFLPTGVGGDGVRAVLLSRTISMPRATVSVVFDRITGMVALSAVLVAAMGFGLPPRLARDLDKTLHLQALWSKPSTLWLLIGAFAISVIMAVLLFRYVLPRGKLRVTNAAQANAVLQPPYGSWGGVLGGAYVLSVMSHMGIVAAHWAVIKSLGLDVSVGAILWLVLLGAVSTLIPITVNGLGLQEGLYVLVLTAYGVPAVAALGVALLIRLLIIGASVLGGLVMLRGHMSKPFASQSQNP